MIGQLMLLDTGVTVVVADYQGNGWWRAIIIHSTNPAYPAGGRGGICISDLDVEKARTLHLTDGVVDMLSWKTPVNGPAPTIESFIAKIVEPAGTPAL